MGRIQEPLHVLKVLVQVGALCSIWDPSCTLRSLARRVSQEQAMSAGIERNGAAVSDQSGAID